MRINTNVAAMQSNNYLQRTGKQLNKSNMRLSSGVRINSAMDDATGLAIANKLKVQLGALEFASKNATEGISLIQTAEGALNEVHSMLQRMKELSVQAANDSYTADDRQKMQMEVDSLAAEIDGISNRTEFNGIKVIGGEGSRLGFSTNRAATGYASQVEVVHISDSVPPGNLDYTLEKIGLPAQVTFDGSGVPFPIVTEVSITLNNETVKIPIGTTRAEMIDILGELAIINGATLQVGHVDQGPPLFGPPPIQYAYPAHDYYVITSDYAGSRQKLNFSTTPLTSYFQNVNSSLGTDAVIKDIDFKDKDGNSLTSFNNAKAVHYDGNKIDVTSSNGQKISLELKISIDTDATPKSKFPPPPLPAVQDEFTLGNIIFDNKKNSHTKWVDYLENGIGVAADFFDKNMDLRVNIKDYGPLILHIGPNSNMEMEIAIPHLKSSSMLLDTINLQNVADAGRSNTLVDKAVKEISNIRGKLGAYQNRLEFTITSLDYSADSIEMARSRIEDTDMAEEMTNLSKLNVMNQAGIAILAQANQRPQQILSLLGR